MTGLNKEQTAKLLNYRGILKHLHRPDIKKDNDGKPVLDENGEHVLNSPNNILEVVDTRSLELEKLKAIKHMWKTFNEFILEGAPQHVQMNAAMKLLQEPDRTYVIKFITDARAEFAARKALIMASANADEVSSIAVKELPEVLIAAQKVLMTF